MNRRCAAAAAALALLAGCSTLAPQQATQDTLSGRLSIAVPATADAPARLEVASFDLRGDAERGQLQLTSPLGNVIAQARWQPGDVRLKRPDGEQHFPDLAALAADVLGEPLPLQALPDWLHGRPWPGAPSAPLPAAAGFEQLGWAVGLGQLQEGLITARRPEPRMVTVRVKLAQP